MAVRIMHPALVLLVRRTIGAKFRRLRSAFRTPKQIIASLFILGFFALILGQSILVGSVYGPSNPDMVRSVVPVGLLAIFLLNVILMRPDSGIVFLPAEVDFLFPAPFLRSELLLYKIIGAAITSAGLGLFFSVLSFWYLPLWIAGFYGIVLALMLVQLTQMVVSLLASTVREKAYTLGRRVVLIVMGLVIVSGLSTVLAQVDDVDFLTVLTRFRESWFGLAVLAPFEVFGRTICAETIPQLAGWGALATGIVLLLTMIVVRLDANFLEVSAVASEKRYEKMRRARRGNPWAALGSSSSRWRMPQFPRWGGAGPIAWRQMCTALRGTRRMLVLLILFGATAAVPMFLVSRSGRDATPFLIIAATMSIFYVPMMLQFDFRGDVDRIDVLKTLPIRPLAMVIGQLATPIAISMLLQLVLIIAATIVQQEVSAPLMIAIAFLPPVNILVFALENLVFLLFPHRLVSSDLQSQGRLMLIMFLKMMVLFLLAGVAAGAGGLAYLVSGGSWTAFGAAAWAVAMILSLSFLPLLCWAFRRIDPTDIPS